MQSWVALSSAFSGLKLPRRLLAAAGNLSLTVQQLLTEILLHRDGLYLSSQPTMFSEYQSVSEYERNLPDKPLATLRNKQLAACFAGSQAVDDVAIGVASLAGRSPREMSDFFGMEYEYVRNRLHRIRLKAAARSGVASLGKVLSHGRRVVEEFSERVGKH